MLVRCLARVGLVALLISQVGCNTTCEQACKKVIVKCDGGYESFPVDQCKQECEALEEGYKDKDTGDEDLADALQEQLNCIGKAECGPLVDPADPDYPACYNEELAVF